MKYLILWMFLILSVSAQESFKGFKLLPRQDNNLDGNIAKYECYVSSDGKNWGTPIHTGLFSNDKTEKIVNFPIKTSRFFKLKAISEGNGRNNSAIAEFNLVGQDDKVLKRDKWVTSSDSNTIPVGKPWGKSENAVDGNPNTFWITNWEKPAILPHEFIIDMGIVTTPVDPTPVVTPVVPVTWKPLVEDDIQGYNLYIGTDPTKLTLHKTFPKTAVEHIVTGLSPNKYYLGLEAFNSTGVKSEMSPLLTYIVVDKGFPTAPIAPELGNIKRFVNVQMSMDGGKTYTSIGKVPYPSIKGQKYKTNIVTEK